MTVDELIQKLQEISLQGCGDATVAIGEVGHISNVVGLQKQEVYLNGCPYLWLRGEPPPKMDVVCLYHN